LPELIERHPRRRGVATLRRVLAEGRVGLERSESDFEAEFAEWLRERCVPAFVQQHPVTLGEDRYRLDFAWPELHVAVELDTPAGHDHPEAIERDKRRDRRLRAAGWTVLRITARAWELERDEVEVDLRAALGLAADAP
jgi:very-short-patch-repair endonuclease